MGNLSGSPDSDNESRREGETREIAGIQGSRIEEYHVRCAIFRGVSRNGRLGNVVVKYDRTKYSEMCLEWRAGENMYLFTPGGGGGINRLNFGRDARLEAKN